MTKLGRFGYWVLFGLLLVFLAGCASEETTVILPADGDSADTDLADGDSADGDSADTEAAELEETGDTDTSDTADGDSSRDECQVDEDCSGCRVCSLQEGVKVCLATPGPRPECMSSADCAEGSACIEARPGCGGYCQAVSQGDYTLHEWGVNVVKAAGSHLASTPPEYYGAVPAKPVIYIYGTKPFSLNAGVRFKAGTATETWPELPNAQTLAWNDIQVTQGACTLTTPPQPPEYQGSSPIASDKEIYELDHWIVPGADCLKVGDTTSRLLFYTGELPSYESPLRYSYTIDSTAGTITFKAENRGDETLSNVLLLYRDVWGDCIDPSYCALRHVVLAFTRLSSLAAGAETTKTLPLIQLNAESDTASVAPPAEWLALGAQFLEDSVALGLSQAEAEKLSAAWNDTFFGVHFVDAQWFLPNYQIGAFALFPWSRVRADDQLALTLNPQPKESKRVIWEWLAQPIPFAATQDGSVEGKVTIRMTTGMPDDPGTVVDAPNAKVSAYKDGLLFAATSSDDKAHYSLKLPYGSYTLVATRYPGEASGDVQVTIAGAETQDLQMVGNAVVDKPNLYLYPTTPTRVKVTLDLAPTRRITQSIPEYGTGWDVLAEPSGLLDGRYTYLFYEAEVPKSYLARAGWSVPAGELAGFFTRILTDYGLTAAETRDFVEYWPTHLPAAPYYLVYPLERAQIDAMVGLNISPLPDSLFRLWFVAAPSATPRELPAPAVLPALRLGFSAVEWGVIVQGR